MKNLILLIKILFTFLSWAFFLPAEAQIAGWNFNGVLTGTGSANAVAGNASLGSTIAAGGAFNGGTVYYGEGAWPTGGIDLNAYLEFSISPTAGHTLTVSSLVMQIRRSTTGTSGAGPNTWSIRSSLDGFATDISSGVLTLNSTPATVVTLGVGFMNLPAKITFRLYGYNATVSSGGLDRFVYDDIQVGGSIILPISIENFQVKSINQSAQISWTLSGDVNLGSLKIEKAINGAEFNPVKEYSSDQLSTETSFEFTDELNNTSSQYAYRLKMISENGEVSYSSIQILSITTGSDLQLKAITTGTSNGQVSFRINAQTAGNYRFDLYNLNGNKVAEKSVELTGGSQILQMNNNPLRSGIYILMAEIGNQKICTKVMVF